MKFKIQYSSHAGADLRNIYEYISKDLQEPQTARNITQNITAEINKLDEMPMRFHLYDDEPWKSKGMRYFNVGNYLIFYIPDENTNTVNVLRIIYGGRDISKQLTEKNKP